MSTLTCETIKNAQPCRDCGIIPWKRAHVAKCPACGRDNTPSALDKLTTKCTAFRDWTEFYHAMEAGYCPTIYQNRKSNRLLTEVVRTAGFPVYIGGGKMAA